MKNKADLKRLAKLKESLRKTKDQSMKMIIFNEINTLVSKMYKPNGVETKINLETFGTKVKAAKEAKSKEIQDWWQIWHALQNVQHKKMVVKHIKQLEKELDLTGGSL